jgi:hypothetical protein
MNNKFDELAKGMAQSVTRRQALRKFGLGMVGVFAAWVGLRGAAAAPANKGKCVAGIVLGTGDFHYTGACINPDTCQAGSSPDCILNITIPNAKASRCGGWVGNKDCSF